MLGRRVVKAQEFLSTAPKPPSPPTRALASASGRAVSATARRATIAKRATKPCSRPGQGRDGALNIELYTGYGKIWGSRRFTKRFHWQTKTCVFITTKKNQRQSMEMLSNKNGDGNQRRQGLNQHLKFVSFKSLPSSGSSSSVIKKKSPHKCSLIPHRSKL